MEEVGSLKNLPHTLPVVWGPGSPQNGAAFALPGSPLGPPLPGPDAGNTPTTCVDRELQNWRAHVGGNGTGQ